MSMQFDAVRDDIIRQLMHERLEQKKERLRERKMEDCREDAIDDARAYIDSLLAVEFGLERRGSLKYPVRPEPPSTSSLDTVTDMQDVDLEAGKK